MSSSFTPPSQTTTSTDAFTTTNSPPAGGGGGGGGISIGGSASLYLYTFLATLVLLLSVSAAIVARSFILRRRQRLMVEEAIRNGTWVPPNPPTRAPRVDLSKKPALWDAYLGGGWPVGETRGLGQESGKDLGIGTNWKLEHSKDWESIKPVYAAYIASTTSVPYSGSTANLPVPIPIPPSIISQTPSTPRGDEENQRTAEVSARPSLFTRARTFFSPTPSPTSPLPASASVDNVTNADNISMTELRSSLPTTMRVAVLIAMPSPPSSHRSSTASSSSPDPNVPQPSTSHPLQQIPPSQPLNEADDDTRPLPVLEMGVAEIVLGPYENSTSWDSTPRRHEKAASSRGSSFAEP